MDGCRASDGGRSGTSRCTGTAGPARSWERYLPLSQSGSELLFDVFSRRYPTRGRERFLLEREFDRLGRVLAELETAGAISTSAAGALRLLMLTGCRRNEIVTLRWEHVDLEHDELRLRDAKTGARAVPLSPAAKQVLTALPRRPDNPCVFPGRVRGTRLHTLNASWQVVRSAAGLEDVRLHDLRHSCGSLPYNSLFLLVVFFCQEFRNQIVTGLDRIPVVACRIRPAESGETFR